MLTQITMGRVPAISIRQPWAELILRGKKTIEIRSWSPDYRGLLWLHAGSRSDPEVEKSFGFLDLFKGGFVGSVVLSTVVPMDRHRWEVWRTKHLDLGNYRAGLYAWLLSSPCRFEPPIPGVGRLNLFFPPIELDSLLHQASSRIQHE